MIIISDTSNTFGVRSVVFRVYVPKDISDGFTMTEQEQFEYRSELAYVEAQSEDGLPDYVMPCEWGWKIDPDDPNYLIGTRNSTAKYVFHVIRVPGFNIEPESELLQFKDAKKHEYFEASIYSDESDKDVCFCRKEGKLWIGRYHGYSKSVVLNQDMIRALLPFLQHFAAYGTFEPKKDEEDEE